MNPALLHALTDEELAEVEASLARIGAVIRTLELLIAEHEGLLLLMEKEHAQ